MAVVNERQALAEAEKADKEGGKVWKTVKGTKILEKDKRFYQEKPDPGFSPERNQKVISESIRRAQIMQAEKDKRFMDELGERAEAAEAYLRSRMGAASNDPENTIEEYLGKKNLAKLRGEKIVEELQVVSGSRGAKKVIRKLGWKDDD